MLHTIKHIVLVIISLFFLLFGIQVLMLAYRLNDPFAFVMTFFASNLMILISAALALGFVLKIRRTKPSGPSPHRPGQNPKDAPPDDDP